MTFVKTPLFSHVRKPLYPETRKPPQNLTNHYFTIVYKGETLSCFAWVVLWSRAIRSRGENDVRVCRQDQRGLDAKIKKAELESIEINSKLLYTI